MEDLELEPDILARIKAVGEGDLSLIRFSDHADIREQILEA